MDIGSTLAIAAITLVVVTVIFETASFIIGTLQSRSIVRDSTDLAKEMHGLVGEIRTLTVGGHKAGEAGEEEVEPLVAGVISQLSDIKDHLGALERRLAEQPVEAPRPARARAEEIKQEEVALEEERPTEPREAISIFQRRRAEESIAVGQQVPPPQAEKPDLSNWERRVLREIASYGRPLLLTRDHPETDVALGRLRSLGIIEPFDQPTTEYVLTGQGRDMVDEVLKSPV